MSRRRTVDKQETGGTFTWHPFFCKRTGLWHIEKSANK